MPKLPLPPRSNFLQWAINKPEEVAAYLQAVYDVAPLANLQVVAVVNGVRGLPQPVKITGGAAIVEVHITTG